MTVLHSGTTKKYSEQWENVFGGGKTKKAPAAAKQQGAAKKKKKAAPAKAKTKKK